MENKQKKGISLIVLVITIIVMIILAAAIILSLNGSGIIGKANKAVGDSNNASMIEAASVALSEYELEVNINKNVSKQKEEYVKDKLNEQGFSEEKLEKLNVLEDGTIQIIPKIPTGFVMSPYKGEQKVKEGLVIYAANSLEGIDHETAMENYNQFVWVPVDDFSKFERTTKFRPTESITPTSTAFMEPFSATTDEGITLSDTNDLTGEYAEYKAMRKSVSQNGGFYIGRYEAGTNIKRQNYTSNGTTELYVQKNKYAYSHVGWGPSMTEEEGDCVYADYNYGDGAVVLARGLYNDSTSVVSTLCYSVQWDAALRFIATNPEHIDFATNSEGKGEYGGGRINTGSNENYKTNNIYDIAGNMAEWTMEAYDDPSGFIRILRGGNWRSGASSQSAGYRGGTEINKGTDGTGFRVALYII